MHLLSFEETLHLVGDCVVWIISEVGGDLIGAGQKGRACPAGDVKNFLVGCLLRHLYWIDGSHCRQTLLVTRNGYSGLKSHLCALAAQQPLFH